MTLFIPINKVDAARRLVYGRISEETPDRSGEVLDYATSKAAFQKWSDDQHKASKGKSRGNLRAMHGKVAAGIFTDITFDDAAKAIDGCAKVVDDAEWAKVESGTYTGFSIGGGYAKRWTCPDDPALKRYTPELTEVSLVDAPCVPTATFEFIKADGTTELRKFHTYEDTVTNDTLAKGNDDQPRDEHGRFASGGGGGKSDDDKRAHHENMSSSHEDEARNAEDAYSQGSHMMASYAHGRAADAVGTSGYHEAASRAADETRHAYAGNPVEGDDEGDKSARAGGLKKSSAKPAAAGDLTKYSPDQERDENGKFGSGGNARQDKARAYHQGQADNHRNQAKSPDHPRATQQAHAAAAAAHDKARANVGGSAYGRLAAAAQTARDRAYGVGTDKAADTADLHKSNHEDHPMTDTTTDSTDKPDAPHTRDGVRQRWLAKDGSDHLTKAAALARNQDVDAEAIAAPALAALDKLEALSKKAKKDDEDEADDEDEKKGDDESDDEDESDEDGGEGDKDDAKDAKSDDEKKPAKKAKKKADKAAAPTDVKKGMYAVSNFASLLSAVDQLTQCSELEEDCEDDDSAMPDKLKAWLKDGAGLLRDMVAEETAELTAGDEDDDVLEMANAVRGLAKRGAVLSAASKDHLHAMHKSAKDHLATMGDHMAALGLHDDADVKDDDHDDDKADKAAGRTRGENAALKKALGDMAPKLEGVLAKFEAANAIIEKLNARIADLEKQPAPARGALRAVEKTHDGGNVSDGDIVTKFHHHLDALPAADKGKLLMKMALANPVPVES